MKKKLPTLYSRTKNGNIQIWNIFVDDNKFYTIEGLVDGKLTESLPTICKGKNLGKKNETTAYQQALKQAMSKWQKKIDKGYKEDINKIDEQNFVEPMLAKKYEDEVKNINFKDGVFSQMKLDGVRCIGEARGLFSRNGKPFVSVPHILEEVKRFLSLIDKNVILDGELYCDKFANDFNQIISLVRKVKPTSQDLQDSMVIKYHVYDLIDKTDLNKNFEERYKQLKSVIDENSFQHIVVVETDKVYDQKTLDKLYGEYINNNYEGQMVRLNKPYEHKRSKFLLKRKEFIDEEYEIIDIVEGEGNRAGSAGYILFNNNDGKQFKSNIKGNFQYLKNVLDTKEELIGKQATVKYFNLTPDGIPRFPFVISIDRKSYE